MTPQTSLLLAIVFLLNCLFSIAWQPYDTRFTGVTWDDDNWRIININLDQGHYQSRISLANGYLGINLASVGPFFDVDVQVAGDSINGWPLFNTRQSFATISGFWDSQPRTNGPFANGTNFEWLYQYGGESVISGVPHWAGLLIQAGDQLLDASVDAGQISNFTSTLDMGSGMMNWDYIWTPSQGNELHIQYSMLVHKLYVNQAAVQLSVTPSQDINVTIIDVLDGDCAVRTDFVESSFDKSSASIFSAVSANGLPDVKAYIYSVLSGDSQSMETLAQSSQGYYLGTNHSTIAQSINAALKANTAANFVKYIGGASTDAFPDAQGTAKNAATSAAKSGWNSLVKSHQQEWEEVMPKDSVDRYAPDGVALPSDPNIVELQIIAVTNPFQLIQNTVGPNAMIAAQNNSALGTNSIPVGGLGSDSYAGFIFWDADVWMAPGLVVSNPHAARQIAAYRAKGLDQAMKNVLTAYQSSQNASGRFSEGGAVYPWTDSRFGNCTGTGPCFDYEYHLNGDIGLSIYNYYAVTGDNDYFKSNLLPTFDAIAWFFAELVTYNSTSGLYDLHNATDPDEYANFVDNAGFTMVLIKNHLERANILRKRFGLPLNETWSDRASKINIPVDTDANLILEYSAMNGSVLVKQADVVLVDDLLEYQNPYSLSDLDFYAGKQSPDGPGMTYGVFSIVANEISPSGCSAYTYDLYSSQPYTRAPWFQFSEQLLDNFQANGGTHPAYPFLTGMGGANRVAVFGYLGLRLMLDSLDITPNLPPQLSYLRYRTIYWQGHPISAWSNTTHTTLSRSSSAAPLPNANSTYLSGSIPVTTNNAAAQVGSLAPGASLVIPNRMIGFNATVAGNIAQCKPANSSQSYEPGQFPIAAVDGAISTKWQPTLSNASAAVTVDLGASAVGLPVVGFALDWAQNPPTFWSVEFSAVAEFGSVEIELVYNTSSVDISNPYDAATAAVITPYVSNTTNVTLASAVPARRYVRLTIEGNQGSPGDTGATVAEFAVVQEGGSRVVPNGFVGG
jgi:trehalose/maltose hydrolase-like predicted phosphorylase